MVEDTTNILMVDDRPENLRALEAVLEELGQNLVRAASAEEALRFLLEEDCAVILLDVHMPNVDGFRTAEMIRSREKTQHIPIVFMSAFHKDERSIEEGYAVGAIDYIVKPFDPDILKAKVAAFVDIALNTKHLEAEIERRTRAESEVRRLNHELERRVAERPREIQTLLEGRRAEEHRAIILQERNRIAQEIHDTLAQGFTGIAIQLEAASALLEKVPREARGHIDRAQGLARRSLAEARRSVLALRPGILDIEDLPGAFRHLVVEVAAGAPSRVELQVKGEPFNLPSEVDAELLRFGQEALTNALNHARATKIVVTLAFEDVSVSLKVRDNGIGFDPAAKPFRERLGLSGMRERVKRLGGDFRLSSRPDRGVVVEATIPLAQELAEAA